MQINEGFHYKPILKKQIPKVGPATFASSFLSKTLAKYLKRNGIFWLMSFNIKLFSKYSKIVSSYLIDFFATHKELITWPSRYLLVQSQQ